MMLQEVCLAFRMLQSSVKEMVNIHNKVQEIATPIVWVSVHTCYAFSPHKTSAPHRRLQQEQQDRRSQAQEQEHNRCSVG